MTTGKDYNIFSVKKHIILVGDYGAGKSSMLHCLIKKEFTSNFSTVSLDFHSYEIKHDDKDLKVFIWDSLGYERFQSITHNFYKKAQGAVLVFDITESDCTETVQRWIQTITTNCKSDIPILVVGNKKDICSNYEQKLSAISLSIPKDINLIDITTASSKTGEKVEELFRSIILAMYTDEKEESGKKRISNSSQGGQIIELTNNSEKSKKKLCCFFT